MTDERSIRRHEPATADCSVPGGNDADGGADTSTAVLEGDSYGHVGRVTAELLDVDRRDIPAAVHDITSGDEQYLHLATAARRLELAEECTTPTKTIDLLSASAADAMLLAAYRLRELVAAYDVDVDPEAVDAGIEYQAAPGGGMPPVAGNGDGDDGDDGGSSGEHSDSIDDDELFETEGVYFEQAREDVEANSPTEDERVEAAVEHAEELIGQGIDHQDAIEMAADEHSVSHRIADIHDRVHGGDEA